MCNNRRTDAIRSRACVKIDGVPLRALCEPDHILLCIMCAREEFGDAVGVLRKQINSKQKVPDGSVKTRLPALLHGHMSRITCKSCSGSCVSSEGKHSMRCCMGKARVGDGSKLPLACFCFTGFCSARQLHTPWLHTAKGV